MKKTDIAYIAGLCDGEAYIGIKKTGACKALTGRVNPGYHERIQIRMVDEQAIKFIAEALGGWYYKEKPHCAKGRPLYCYQASDKQAANIIRVLLPFLRVKKNSALTVLKLRSLKDSQKPEKAVLHTINNKGGGKTTLRRRRFSARQIRARENLWNRCKRLNKTGA